MSHLFKKIRNSVVETPDSIKEGLEQEIEKVKGFSVGEIKTHMNKYLFNLKNYMEADEVKVRNKDYFVKKFQTLYEFARNRLNELGRTPDYFEYGKWRMNPN